MTVQRIKRILFQVIIYANISFISSQVALDFQTNHPSIDLKVVDFEKNKGKGAAIRVGMLTAVGDYRLMVDADGATDINDFQKVFDELKKIENNKLGLVAGSRNHLVQGVVKKRKFYRNILMYCSNFVIQTICGVKLKVFYNEIVSI